MHERVFLVKEEFSSGTVKCTDARGAGAKITRAPTAHRWDRGRDALKAGMSKVQPGGQRRPSPGTEF